jgi:lipopolysaccharide transport system ATP-binding protein
MSSEIAIKVENLSKCYQIYDNPSDRLKQMIMGKINRKNHRYYREFWAVKDVSFEVKKGETVGIIGRNGCGKSTLLQMICGTLNPSAGSITTQGRVAALLELGSGFNPEFTGRENVFLNASVLGLSREETTIRFEDITAFADIGDFIDQPVKTYSSGMLVRLAFAVIAHVDADILVIDEALAVGDTFFTQKCMRFLRNFMKSNTVLFVSHDTSSIKSLCTKAIWLEQGEVLESGTPKDVSDLYLEAFYEAQQGKSTKTIIRPEYQHRDTRVKKDQRLEFINKTNLRNDIELYEFNPDAPSFGDGGATIVDVTLCDPQNHPLAWVVGGEDVVLQIRAVSNVVLNSPIVGFFVKDKLGQMLFGDNTYFATVDTPLKSDIGQEMVAEFHFNMPRLAKGDYSICTALAEGTYHSHVQQHWIHDAVLFKCDTTSLSSGLIGIPMQSVKLFHPVSTYLAETP